MSRNYVYVILDFHYKAKFDEIFVKRIRFQTQKSYALEYAKNTLEKYWQQLGTL